MGEVSNSSRYIGFLIGLIALCALSLSPLAFRVYSDFTMVFPYIGIGLSLLSIIVIRPTYFGFAVKDDQLFIRTNPMDDDSFRINKNDFAGYELKPKMFGLKQELVIYKHHVKGLLKSEPYYIFFFSKEQLAELKRVLDYFKS